jgi:hypothetical protein
MPITAPATPSERPGLVTAIAVMTLVSGILNILWSGILALGLLATLVGLLCIPLAIYPLVLGILEIIYAARLLSSHPPAVRPARYLAIMQICDILLGNIISLLVGILSLVFYSDSAVKSYFGESTSAPAQAPPS